VYTFSNIKEKVDKMKELEFVEADDLAINLCNALADQDREAVNACFEGLSKKSLLILGRQFVPINNWAYLRKDEIILKIIIWAKRSIS